MTNSEGIERTQTEVESHNRVLSLTRFLLLLSLGLVEFVRGGFFIALYPIYATQHLGLSVAWVGVILSAHYLSETVSKPLAGASLDIIPRRYVLTVGLLFGLVGLLSTLLVSHPWVSLIGAILWGVGVSPVWLAVLGAAKDVGQGQGRWMSRAYTFWLAGIGLSIIVVNVLMQRMLWAVLVILVAVWIAAIFVVMGTGNQRMMGSRKSSQLWFFDMVSFLRQQWPVLSGVFLQTMAASMLIPILPLFANRDLGLSNLRYAIFLALGGTFVVVIMLLIGKLVDSRGPRSSLVAGFFLCGVGVAVLGLSRALNLMTVLSLGILALGYGLVLPAWNTFVATLIPSGRQASAWGVYTTAEGIGVSIGPALGGLISQGSGLPSAFLVSGLILLVLAAFYGLRFALGQN